MYKKPLIRIVDDDPGVLDSLSFALESEGWEVAVYDSAAEFLKADAPSRPGCLILDYAMPDVNGLELQQMMRERCYNLPIVFLTGHGDIAMAVTAIRNGAVEFLQKTAEMEEISKAISSAVARSLAGFADLSMDAFEARRRLSGLTERQLKIVKMIASGLLNRQISERLAISVRTVETHRAAALKTLEVKGVDELVSLLALAEGSNGA